MLFYHGTDFDFETLNTSFAKDGSKANGTEYYGEAVYFSDSIEVAKNT